MLTTHQLIGAASEDDLRGDRHPAAVTVLGARDPAEVLVQYGDLRPALVQQRLEPLGPRPLGVRLPASGLVLPGRDGRVRVQPRHLGAEPGVAARVGGFGGAGGEHGERAQQRRDEQRMTAR